MEIVLEEQLERVRLAKRLWKERVKPDEVMGDLIFWRCGTQACFGGHLVEWPEFQKLGVKSEGFPSYGPMMLVPAGMGTDFSITKALAPCEIAEVLFGDENLFAPRFEHEADADWSEDDFNNDTVATDYEVVLNRLDWAEGVLMRRIAAAQVPA